MVRERCTVSLSAMVHFLQLWDSRSRCSYGDDIVFPAPKVVGIPVISTANMLRSGALWLKDLLKYESQANTSYQMV